MKIALAQLNYRIGDFDYNTTRILESIGMAKARQADLVIFSELSVCGYPPLDFLEFDDFVRKSMQSVETIAASCKGIAAVVGAPSVNPAQQGKPLYNSAFFLAEGKIRGVAHKTLLPNYDVFDEYRYFEPNRLPYNIIEYQGSRIALTVCEDLWNVTDDPLYIRNPMDALIPLGPDLIINIAASPFHYDQPSDRREVLVRNALTYHRPIVYVNQVGGQTELVFDGNSMMVAADGTLVTRLKGFEEELKVVDFDPFTPLSGLRTEMEAEPLTIASIHSALVLGIRDYFGKMNFRKALLGLSGGIDSAVTLALAVEALGQENLLGVLLPSQFSSDHSIEDARALAEKTGVQYEIIPIEKGFRVMQESLEPWFHGLPFGLAEENMQARLRAVILMALSNKFGYILLNTSNKSEAAVGYGTLYGDMCGGLSVLGDVYKTQVYELARYINSLNPVIPENSILKPPSAELRPDQKDSDSLPPYDLLDRILVRYIEGRRGPDELVSEGFDEAIVRRVLKMVNTSEYKRHQAPPILRVSPKAFGLGRRLPIAAQYLS